MSGPLLIAAISGRALAAAARRAGYEPVVLDLFNDRDTRALASRSQAVAGSIEQGFEADALLTAAAAVPGPPLVYGAGFEDRPELLAELAAGRRLYGNAPETLARIKDPAMFFPLLDRLGIPHPEIALSAPDARTDWPRGWLVKRIGGAGGAHVRAAQPVHAGGDAGAVHYFQRRSEGRSVSALFLANGSDALTLGFSLQWRAPGRGLGFLFGGAGQPARFEPAIAEAMAGILPRLAAETGLVGLNSADFLVRPDGFELLEINPRPGATLDIFDKATGGDGQGLLALHLAACDGVLPPAWWPAPGACACAVLYAPRDLTVPKHFAWPGWTADRPEGGSAIPAGAPLCTVLAEAAETSDVDRVRRLVEQRSRQLLRAIEHPGTGALLGAA